jgi:hypothetical protein
MGKYGQLYAGMRVRSSRAPQETVTARSPGRSEAKEKIQNHESTKTRTKNKNNTLKTQHNNNNSVQFNSIHVYQCAE